MTDSSQLFADVVDDAHVSETPLVDEGFAYNPANGIQEITSID